MAVGMMCGSSPRMRGARRHPKRRTTYRGIIPAYAGSTPVCCRSGSVSGDHPRVCGEHWNWINTHVFTPGSSPRMRGARRSHRAQVVHRGIIPAYAGSTIIHNVPIAVEKDHPRVCGEHVDNFSPSGNVMGSSPRMRGALAQAFDAVADMRIIPAYAGSTHMWVPAGCWWGDHPRVCGEHFH